MTGDLMTLRDLRVQTFKERREGRLTKLPSTFYSKMVKLEGQIRDVIENTKDDPKKFEKANSDIRKFMDMKLELHKHRERKLTDLAREKVNGQSPNTENAQENEIKYLVALCGVIEEHRKKTLLSKNIKSTKIINKIKEQKIKETKLKETENTKINETQVGLSEKTIDNEEYVKVEILEDLPTFTGMDANNYTLKNNDVVNIPIYNAKILSDAGKVKIIKEVKT